MSVIVPLQAVPNQLVNIALANQACQIKVGQTLYGLYMSLYVNNELILGGVICQNMNRIIRDAYFGFVGDFTFLDNQGNDDPDYTGLGGLGARFNLIYLEVSDIA